MSNNLMMRARATALVKLTVEVSIGDLPADSDMARVLRTVQERVTERVEALLSNHLDVHYDGTAALVRIVIDGDLYGLEKLTQQGVCACPEPSE